MPTILNTLQGHDLTYIRMVANAWGIELDAPDVHKARPALLNAISDPNLILEIYTSLPSKAREALNQLRLHDGHLAWAQFSRDFGDVRVMGAAKRDRERPDLNPASPAEVLWYRALIGRAFLSINNEPQEYAYIPEEILAVIPAPEDDSAGLPGRPASPGESRHLVPVSIQIINDLTTLLAAFRNGDRFEDLAKLDWDTHPYFLLQVLQSGGLIDQKLNPNTEKIRAFLEKSPNQAITEIVNLWLKNGQINEFILTPGLVFENEPDFSAAQVRSSLLAALSLIPEEQWWNIDSFVDHLHKENPNFLRPAAGDYDSWFIRDAQSGEYLRGYAHWDQVEGAFLRFFITGPLHWLGIFDLGHGEDPAKLTAFKRSEWGRSLWQGKNPKFILPAVPKIKLDRYGLLSVPQHTKAALRYQIARFAEWKGKENGVYQYQISPQSLKRASGQGLHVSHIFKLLKNHLKDPFPPALKTALENWEESYEAGKISKASILRLPNAETLEKLLNSRGGRSILETLSPTTAIIRPGQEEALRKALLEMGSIVDFDLD